VCFPSSFHLHIAVQSNALLIFLAN
jgi:hypothetical protein